MATAMLSLRRRFRDADQRIAVALLNEARISRLARADPSLDVDHAIDFAFQRLYRGRHEFASLVVANCARYAFVPGRQLDVWNVRDAPARALLLRHLHLARPQDRSSQRSKPIVGEFARRAPVGHHVVVALIGDDPIDVDLDRVDGTPPETQRSLQASERMTSQPRDEPGAIEIAPWPSTARRCASGEGQSDHEHRVPNLAHASRGCTGRATVLSRAHHLTQVALRPPGRGGEPLAVILAQPSTLGQSVLDLARPVDRDAELRWTRRSASRTACRHRSVRHLLGG